MGRILARRAGALAAEPKDQGAAPVLEVRGLAVEFATDDGPVRAVDGISYAVPAGRTLGVVGESGCGKSVTALALMRLVPPPGRIVAGEVRLEGEALTALGERAMRAVRGARVAMIFQEPMTALNPVFSVGDQIAETFRLHREMGRAEAWEGAVAMLDRVGIPDPAQRARDYPHQLSGGMRQRAMIAMALACRPALLLADEPTTALDVTIQAQILDLMLDIQDQLGMAIQFISHNLGVISEVADEVMVMYAGRVVERAPADALFAEPLHPYTAALMATVPQLGRRRALAAIPGSVPPLHDLPRGCRFRNRCALAGADCAEAEPELRQMAGGRHVACFRAGQ